MPKIAKIPNHILRVVHSYSVGIIPRRVYEALYSECTNYLFEYSMFYQLTTDKKKSQ
jgi:hypothetical protein